MHSATSRSTLGSFFAHLLVILFALFIFVISPPSLALTEIQGEDLMTGQKLELATRAKGIVVVFLSARCPCSHSHIDILKKLSHEFGDFQFVAIHSNADETKDESIRYFKDQKMNFSVIQDENLKWADELKASKTPHVFVFNQAGELVYKGGVTSSAHGPTAEKQYLKDALTAVQAGQKVAVSETRNLGCAISRGEKHVW